MTITLPTQGVVASESVTVDATAGGVALTAATYTIQESSMFATERDALSALITVESYPIRWNINPGVTVTAIANGHTAAAADVIWLTSSAQIRNFKAIRTTGDSATLRITYFR